MLAKIIIHLIAWTTLAYFYFHYNYSGTYPFVSGEYIHILWLLW